MSSPIITLYINEKVECAFCNLAKRILSDAKMSFEIKPITKEIVLQSPSQLLPIVSVGNNIIGGYFELVAYVHNKLEKESKAMPTIS